MTEPVKIDITDELDLHSFRPDEVADLMEEYFSECIRKKIYVVRVVHGKGTGALKKRVESALQKNPLVENFRDATPDAGGWGATRVELKHSL